jgi:hypothetical protein
MTHHRLKASDWVQVRTKEEILAALDKDGRLDGMPFMPEMLKFCGMKLQVHKRAHKTCDTVFPIRSRRVKDAVHLSTRCDGAAHGGCQAACLLFWKETWLRPLERRGADDTSSTEPPRRSQALCSEADLLAATRKADAAGGEVVYVCQATQLPYMTTRLAWWDVRQYVEDWRSGNVGLRQILAGAFFMGYYRVSQAGIGLGPAMRWLWDRLAPLWRGTPWPRRPGLIPEGQPTPTDDLGLQEGEWVRVKPYREILKTLNLDNQNRGMRFDAELVPFCGRAYKVLRRVTKIINEQTGAMLEMKTPAIILDSVVCQAKYSPCRLFCPRAIYPYWREIWLERVEPRSATIRIERG